LADFDIFIGTFYRQFAIIWLLYIPRRKKTSDNKHLGNMTKTLQTNISVNDSYDTRLF